MKIAITIPVYLNIPDNFFINFIARIQELNKKYEFRIFTIAAQPADRTRNMLVSEALKWNPDYILWIDSDIIFPKFGIDKLIDTMNQTNADIVSGLYFSKRKPHVPMIMKFNSDGTHSIVREVDFNRIIKIDAYGLGFCLVKIKIFKELTYPWFQFRWKEKKENNKIIKYQTGEDLNFFDKVKKKGYSVYLNTGIICSHCSIPLEAYHYLYYKNGK